ncbi:MAG TPA: tRNA preQ1(34) S-adenosylmethionine ribosyltransferase-isomerase QueA [Fimbriimonadaceae bacterium]|nr:tRNA preQ1(34) S-adenosylmethionine ribosyltransferase-isomerase QueA [Fimbriimonadaceae bacterium]
MRLSDLQYDLPEELIAQKPLDRRDASRLLTVDKSTGEIGHRKFMDVVDLLREGDLLVMNDTRVTALRLFGKRKTGANVEALLLTPLADGKFVALTRPAKKLKRGELIEFEGGLTALVAGDLGDGKKTIEFQEADAEDRIKAVGRTPLPPYVKSEIPDPERYQTVYARQAGSAAAPTAGLHFTNELLQAFKDKGVETATVTLDVSTDTFRPISVENVEDHKMHGERCTLPKETVRKLQGCKGSVVAVGTTTVRTLESFASLEGGLQAGTMTTSAYITPGYEFKVVDAMFTNFHMPGTTMLLMVAAMCGHETLMRAYAEAVERRYRFLSFGDSMFVC